MRKLLSIAGLLLFVGCGKGGDVGKIISQYDGFKNQLCKCADKACADKVQADTTAWLGKQVEAMSKMKPSKDQEEKWDKIENEIEACTKKFEAAEAPPAEAPPAEAPPAEGATPPAEGGAATPPAEGATPPAGDKPATP